MRRYNNRMSVILPILVATLGWVAGVVVNYFSDVLPLSRKLKKPQCWYCNEELEWKRFLFSWQKCKNCDHKRQKRAGAVEVGGIMTAIWLWNSPPTALGFWTAFFIIVYFASVVVMDIEHRVILHPVSWFGAIMMGGIGIWQHGVGKTLLGGAAGFGILFILYYLGDIFAQWMAKRRDQEFDDVALGFGDVNLAGVIGLLMGWPGITGGLIVGITAAGVYSFFYILYKLITRSYSAFATIPYGPFLIFGAVFLLYFRDFLIAV